jgi:hypothetical protein
MNALTVTEYQADTYEDWVSLEEASKKYNISVSMLRNLKRKKVIDNKLIDNKLYLSDNQLTLHYQSKPINFNTQSKIDDKKNHKLDEFLELYKKEKDEQINELKKEINRLNEIINQKDKNLNTLIESTSEQLKNEQLLRLESLRNLNDENLKLKDDLHFLENHKKDKKWWYIF